MKKIDIEKIAKEISSRTVTSADIPSIDLYLDQILTIVSEKNGPDAPPLTKTMINNYSKDGLINPIKGKKYSKEHILQMCTIYYLKGILSMGDIKKLLSGVCDKDFISCYDSFARLREERNESSYGIICGMIEKNELDVSQQKDLLLLVMLMSTTADFLKASAEKMLSEAFPDTDDKEKGKEKEKDKDKPKEKDKDKPKDKAKDKDKDKDKDKKKDAEG